MPSAKKTNKPSHVTTGNVLEELGFSADQVREMEIQHGLWVPIRTEIEARGLTQAAAAKLLQIHQPDASLLLRGQLARFSISRLMQFADRLGLAVTLAVTPKAAIGESPNGPRIPTRKPSRQSRPLKQATGSVALRSQAAG